MPTLADKIEAHAAQRLVLPPDRHPRDELARFRHFLKVETHRLKILHRGGAGGREVCRARATVIDALVQHIVKAGVGSGEAAASQPVPPFAVVAIGGYGRGELNPHSDVDLMFLIGSGSAGPGKVDDRLKRVIDALLYTLWDIGLKIGHSVRSVDDCVRVANLDLQSKTSLLESRFLTGDVTLYERMRKVFWDKCVRGHVEEYIDARLEDQAGRRAKYGNSACMQEPNVKNGCGGLRDFQNLLWMACFKLGIWSLDELETRGQISAGERKKLEAAYDFLLRVRNELHYFLDKPADVLPKSIQPAIAHKLGYQERSPVKRLERFMRDFYTHARAVYLLACTLEQRLALLPQPRRVPTLREFLRHRRYRAQYPIDGFKFLDGEVFPVSARTFSDQPRRLMRVFLHAQQRGLRLTAEVSQLIRQHLPQVDRSFLKDEHVRETFLQIVNQRGNVARVLRAMHEVGLLGKYLPEFGRLTCRVQHEFYHRYAADEHTLVCLEKLDQIWGAEEPPFVHYKQIFQSIERPFLLYLAILLHDSGKALGDGKHADSSARLAVRVAKRLGLNEQFTQTLKLLVENHLLMAQVSQRRDLDDPVVARHFAARAKTPENLNMLTLQTFADSMGTSDTLWNDFKESLLWTLHDRAMAALTGVTEFQRTEERQRELQAQRVEELVPRSVSPAEVQAHLAHLPARYAQLRTAREMAEDLTLAHRVMQACLDSGNAVVEPMVAWHHEPDRGYTAVKICTWDLAGLFSQIAGALALSGLNILGAHIFTRQDGLIFDTFFVNDAATGKLPTRDQREQFEKVLRRALNNEIDLAPLISSHPMPRSLYQPLEGEQIPTVIEFDNSSSEDCTVIDVETEDHVGLLHAMSKTLSAEGLDISLARISTEKGAAMDTFYVRQADGAKLKQAERLRAVEQRLRDAIAQLVRQ